MAFILAPETRRSWKPLGDDGGRRWYFGLHDQRLGGGHCFNAISGDQVADCRGIGSGNGVIASAAAQNCFGQGGLNCFGVNVSGTALNCYGTSSSSSTGLSATIAQNCIGSSASGIGLQATIANSCLVGHGTTNVTSKYNMP